LFGIFEAFIQKSDKMAIVKSNKLIETSYTLGSREQFFVLFLISQISQKDTEFREYRINYKEISQLMNFDAWRIKRMCSK
jgi:hypothetical protein